MFRICLNYFCVWVTLGWPLLPLLDLLQSCTMLHEKCLVLLYLFHLCMLCHQFFLLCVLSSSNIPIVLSRTFTYYANCSTACFVWSNLMFANSRQYLSMLGWTYLSIHQGYGCYPVLFEMQHILKAAQWCLAVLELELWKCCCCNMDTLIS